MGRGPYQTPVVMTQGGSESRSSRSDEHSTAHGHVLSRVVSRLIQISVFPSFGGGLTSYLNNKPVSEREIKTLKREKREREAVSPVSKNTTWCPSTMKLDMGAGELVFCRKLSKRT